MSVPPSNPLPEPRAFTVRDWFFVVAGVATASLMPGPFAGVWVLGISPVVAIFLLVVKIALAPAFVVTFVLLGRQCQYRRTAKPAEQLALALVGWQISAAVPNLDTVISGLHIGVGMTSDFDWSAWRWGFAGIALLLALLIVGSSYVLRGHRRAWLQSLGVVAAVALLFWAPLDVLRREPPWPAWLVLAPPYTSVALLIRDTVSCVPNGLVFAVPAVATLISWRRRPRGWVWTEWVSAGSALVLALLWLVMLAIGVIGNGQPADWVWSIVVWSAWLFAVSGVAALYAVHAGSRGS